MSAGNGHVRLLDRQPPKPTKAQQDEIAKAMELLARNAATDQVKDIVEYYFAQIPELVGKMVATMLAEAFAAHGMELKPPTVGTARDGESPVGANVPLSVDQPNPTTGCGCGGNLVLTTDAGGRSCHFCKRCGSISPMVREGQ